MVWSFSGVSLVTLYYSRYVCVRTHTCIHVHMHIQSCFASVTMYKQVDILLTYRPALDVYVYICKHYI